MSSKSRPPRKTRQSSPKTWMKAARAQRRQSVVHNRRAATPKTHDRRFFVDDVSRPEDLRVISFNAEWFFDGKNNPSFLIPTTRQDPKRKSAEIVQLLKRHSPDLICLQEVDGIGVLRLLAAEFLKQTKVHYTCYHNGHAAHKTQQSVGLLASDRVHVVSFGWRPSTHLTKHLIAQVRFAPLTTVLLDGAALDPVSAAGMSTDLTLIVIHLKSRPSDARQQERYSEHDVARSMQGQELAMHVKATGGATQGPVLVCGDFNTFDPDWPGVSKAVPVDHVIRDLKHVPLERQRVAAWAVAAAASLRPMSGHGSKDNKDAAAKAKAKAKAKAVRRRQKSVAKYLNVHRPGLRNTAAYVQCVERWTHAHTTDTRSRKRHQRNRLDCHFERSHLDHILVSPTLDRYLLDLQILRGERRISDHAPLLATFRFVPGQPTAKQEFGARHHYGKKQKQQQRRGKQHGKDGKRRQVRSSRRRSRKLEGATRRRPRAGRGRKPVRQTSSADESSAGGMEGGGEEDGGTNSDSTSIDGRFGGDEDEDEDGEEGEGEGESESMGFTVSSRDDDWSPAGDLTKEDQQQAQPAMHDAGQSDNAHFVGGRLRRAAPAPAGARMQQEANVSGNDSRMVPALFSAPPVTKPPPPEPGAQTLSPSSSSSSSPMLSKPTTSRSLPRLIWAPGATPEEPGGDEVDDDDTNDDDDDDGMMEEQPLRPRRRSVSVALLAAQDRDEGATDAFRKDVSRRLAAFKADASAIDLRLPGLSTEQRRVVHLLCRSTHPDLLAVSRGRRGHGEGRVLLVRKTACAALVEAVVRQQKLRREWPGAVLDEVRGLLRQHEAGLDMVTYADVAARRNKGRGQPGHRRGRGRGRGRGREREGTSGKIRHAAAASVAPKESPDPSQRATVATRGRDGGAELDDEREDVSGSDAAGQQGLLLDMTGVPFVTIDSASTRDLDHAIYIADGDPRVDGPDCVYVVHVALADISFYVRPGSALFAEALARGASYFLPERVIPMLPPALSQGLACLNPGLPRRALVFTFRLDAQGDPIVPSSSSSSSSSPHAGPTQVRRCKIRSRAKLSFEIVSRLYDVDFAMFAGTAYRSSLVLLQRVGELRLASARQQDALLFDRKEVSVVTHHAVQNESHLGPEPRLAPQLLFSPATMNTNTDTSRARRTSTSAADAPALATSTRALLAPPGALSNSHFDANVGMGLMRMHSGASRLGLGFGMGGDGGFDGMSNRLPRKTFAVETRGRGSAEIYVEQLALLCNTEGTRMLADAEAEAEAKAQAKAVAEESGGNREQQQQRRRRRPRIQSSGETVLPVLRVERAPAPSKLAELVREIKAVVAEHGLPPTWHWRRGEETLSDFLYRLPLGVTQHEATVRAVIVRNAAFKLQGATLCAAPGPHFGLGTTAHVRFTASMHEVVGIQTHAQLLAGLGLGLGLGLADLSAAEEVMRAAELAQERQKNLSKTVQLLHVENSVFLHDLALPLGERPRHAGDLFGIHDGGSKLMVTINDPPVDVKVSAEDLMADEEDTFATDEAGCVVAFKSGVAFAVGDAVAVFVKGYDETRKRWQLGLELQAVEDDDDVMDAASTTTGDDDTSSPMSEGGVGVGVDGDSPNERAVGRWAGSGPPEEEEQPSYLSLYMP